MPSSTTELIKSKLDIVDFLRGYLNVQPAGKNFKAPCPFHKEKTPSFMISPDRQSWHCFGCGLGGDIFGFVMRYENLEFGEALRVLAEKAGVELRRLDPAEHKFTGLLYELNGKASEFFKSSLKNFPGGKKYLAERGLKPETIDEFELGWAPNEVEALTTHLLRGGYAPEDIVRAGLCLKTERGMVLDRFRGRVMFPIHNHFGRVVGFTGRIFPQFETAEGMGSAKYVNSPETPIFNKSRLLYGFWKSKNPIRETGSVFMVEGQMDFLMSWQAGVKNAVASSGTALTPDHLHTLRRIADTLILSFDNDAAGSAAAERAIDLAETADFGVKVVAFEKFKDPAEAAQAGERILLDAVANATPAPQFYFDKYLPKAGTFDTSKRESIKNLRIVIGKVKQLASAVERDFWLKALAKRTGVEERVLLEEAEKVDTGRGGIPREDDAVPLTKQYSRRERIGEQLLRAVVAKNDFSCLDDCVPHFAPVHRSILGILKDGKRGSPDPEIDNLMNFIVLGSADLPASEIATLKAELMKEEGRDRRTELVAAVRSAEEAGDETRLRKSLEELNEMSRNSA